MWNGPNWSFRKQRKNLLTLSECFMQINFQICEPPYLDEEHRPLPSQLWPFRCLLLLLLLLRVLLSPTVNHMKPARSPAVGSRGTLVPCYIHRRNEAQSQRISHPKMNSSTFRFSSTIQVFFTIYVDLPHLRSKLNRQISPRFFLCLCQRHGRPFVPLNKIS